MSGAQRGAQGSPQFKAHLASGADLEAGGSLAVLKRSGIVLAFCLLSAAPGQSPPSPVRSPPLRGFVPPYEILRTVRAAGFEPLAPPLREGTTYVVRAIDFRGVAMRVVVDARSGAIRDANRIVSGPGLYGPYVPGPYGPVVYRRLAPPPYPPDDIEAGYGQPPYVGTTALAPGDRHFPGLSLVPLPRPRPGSLATTSAAAATSAAPSPNEKKPGARPDVATSAPPAAQPDRTSRPSAGPAIPAIND